MESLDVEGHAQVTAVLCECDAKTVAAVQAGLDHIATSKSVLTQFGS